MCRSVESKPKALGIISIVLGVLSFIPFFGIFIGIVAIIIGIVDIVKNKSKLGIIGLVLGVIGILISIGVYGSLFYFGFFKKGGVYDDLRIEMAKKQLTDTINAIEAYKARFGEYPERIQDLEKISDALVYTDQLQIVNQIRQTGSNDTTFFYENKGDFYYLFSRGIDGEAFTNDDIFPLLDGDIGTLGYREP